MSRQNKKPEVKPQMTRLNKWRLFWVSFGILCFGLFVGGCIADSRFMSHYILSRLVIC